jgi:molybdate transport system substrate-binding protein
MRPALRSLLLAALAVSFAADVATAATVQVFAAASLTEAFHDIAALYEKQNPGDDLEFNFGGSQTLRTQIEEGAGADVFASADRVHMDALKERGLVKSDSVFARNRLVVVTPSASPKIRRLADLARPGIRIVVADANVPVGRYTAEALGKMARGGAFGDDFEKRVAANVVSRETNVRAVLAKVALDEVDAGVVYATDAVTAAAKVVSLEIPDSLNVVAEYPIAVLAKSRVKDAAARFVALVLGPAGRAALAKRGFQPPP